ncbi:MULTISPECIES: L,D-transpeptidase family protein [unclassified Streptomyces]|uniref:L,D-transpeptidase family protein n=1 Tax=unclassified Streptomyces TaxID=2593676 RepID=UPI00214B000F|nr:MULTISPECIES: L,D-transpeptidase family protein [unclassified Streptomyces]MCX5012159.1 L,D-transpeptidase family protein [Streptomyces sp. NBC_00555]MCX5606119.1 L,D-transpeptidase family protein [Streptomyces sp. NBC_00047]UUU40374.1 L,D-transpeptidase family protein [Streptomyces sp. NBC_00162]
MHRQRVIFRTLGVATAVALAATACGPQKSESAGSPSPVSSSPTAGASPESSPSTDDKPASPSPSASASASPSASPSPTVKQIMANGDDSEQVRELQARLKQLKLMSVAPTGFYGTKTTAAVKSYQSKNGLNPTGSVDEATWKKIQGATKKPTADELRPPAVNEADAPDPRCMEGRVMCISKESRTLAWMIDGKIISTMDVRFGSENTPTREGVFKVDRKEKEWTSTLYHTSMPYSMFFSGGQAVHYSADFAARGYAGASHGCVNVRDKGKLSALFAQVQAGDKVVVYW